VGRGGLKVRHSHSFRFVRRVILWLHRNTFCALLCLRLIGQLDSIDQEAVCGYVVRCQNSDGGFGIAPGTESHAGMMLVCLLVSVSSVTFDCTRTHTYRTDILLCWSTCAVWHAGSSEYRTSWYSIALYFIVLYCIVLYCIVSKALHFIQALL
jgi:hypothetical protein